MPESDEDRHHRELIELLNELRVALPGVQVPVSAAVFVITDFIFHRAWAATFTAIVAAWFLVFWYGLPLAAARRRSRRAR